MTLVSIGIDLAWKENGDSGIAILVDKNLVLWQVSAFTNDDLVDILDPYLDQAAIIAIDAPLFVPNENGMRSCELEFKKQRISGLKISILGSNRRFLLNQFGTIRGENLVATLQLKLPNGSNSQFLETFPTASTVGIFGERIPYKFSAAKTKAGVITGMSRLIEMMMEHSWFSQYDEQIHSRISKHLVGKSSRSDLKELEDLLDALICVYTSWQTINAPDGVVRCSGDKKDGEIVYSDS